MDGVDAGSQPSGLLSLVELPVGARLPVPFQVLQKACAALALVAAVAALLSVVESVVHFLAFGAFLAASLSGIGALFVGHETHTSTGLLRGDPSTMTRARRSGMSLATSALMASSEMAFIATESCAEEITRAPSRR